MSLTKPKSEIDIQTSSAGSSKAEEARNSLESHRCAICQNVLINACRIDCGHTFCRHCLNVDRENKNESRKPTCFICDAVITEICQNAEKDKIIDDSYTLLSTDERLQRESTKSDRKKEEESFSKKADLESRENSADSIASGDASYNRDIDTQQESDTTQSWTIRHDSCSDEVNIDERNVTVYQQGPFLVLSLSSGEEEPEEAHGHSAEQSSVSDTCRCHFYGDVINGNHTNEMSDNESDFSSNHQSEFSAEEEENDNPSYILLDSNNRISDDTLQVLQQPHSPYPQPVVIQHTVQHIYHTVDDHQRENEEFSSGWIPSEYGSTPRCREEQRLRRPPQYDDYGFGFSNNHYRGTAPTYNYYYPAGHAQPQFYPCNHPQAMYPGNAPGHQFFPVYSHPYPQTQYQRYHSAHMADRERNYNCTQAQGQRSFENRDNIHLAMHNMRNQSENYATASSASRNHENIENELQEFSRECDDNDGNYESETDDVITFNVTLPISFSGNAERRRSENRSFHSNNESGIQRKK